jgi:hypothetical protein
MGMVEESKRSSFAPLQHGLKIRGHGAVELSPIRIQVWSDVDCAEKLTAPVVASRAARLLGVPAPWKAADLVDWRFYIGDVYWPPSRHMIVSLCLHA